MQVGPRFKRSEHRHGPLPPAPGRRLLHHSWRDRRWRTGNTHACAGIDNGDCVSRSDGGGLVNLHQMIVNGGEIRRNEGGRG